MVCKTILAGSINTSYSIQNQPFNPNRFNNYLNLKNPSHSYSPSVLLDFINSYMISAASPTISAHGRFL